MLSNPLSKAGFIIIVCVFLLAMLAPIIAPYDPDDINVKAILLAPSMQHWMGTDGLGRDVLTRMLLPSSNRPSTRYRVLTGIRLAG